jgi:hypothetical protein
MAEQQVQLTDLDPVQLQEVKKQLDQVSRRAGAGRRRAAAAAAGTGECICSGVIWSS